MKYECCLEKEYAIHFNHLVASKCMHINGTRAPPLLLHWMVYWYTKLCLDIIYHKSWQKINGCRTPVTYTSLHYDWTFSMQHIFYSHMIIWRLYVCFSHLLSLMWLRDIAVEWIWKEKTKKSIKFLLTTLCLTFSHRWFQIWLHLHFSYNFIVFFFCKTRRSFAGQWF